MQPASARGDPRTLRAQDGDALRPPAAGAQRPGDGALRGVSREHWACSAADWAAAMNRHSIFKAVSRQRRPGKAVNFGDRRWTKMNSSRTITQAITSGCDV